MARLTTQYSARLKRLYHEHFEYVLRTALRLGVEASDADDLVQDVFVVVAKKVGELDLERGLRPYLFGVTRNCVRARRRMPSHESERAYEYPSRMSEHETAQVVYAGMSPK